MPFSYKKLFKLMIDKNISKVELKRMIGCSSNTLAALSKDEAVSMKNLDKICEALDCNIEDIIEHIKENPAGE